MGSPAMPSKACQPCRVKRRKCDKKLPGCSQCRRAKVVCLGYRDDFSSRLRDQTVSTAHKFQTLDKTSGSVSPMAMSPVMRSRSASDMQHAQTTPDALVVHKLSASPEDVALGYFLNFYAPATQFDYLSEASTVFLCPGPLRSALLAPSLLLLSQNFQSTALQALAQDNYAKALRLTSSVLSGQVLVTCDSTLLAVLLLSVYEALAFQGRQVPSAWSAHIRGAFQLLQMRGETQFDSSLGRNLFLHASCNIRIDCTQRGMKAPPALGALQSSLVRNMDPRDPNIRLGAFLDQFANLRSRICDFPPLSRTHKALELDKELVTLLDDLWRLVPFISVDVATLPGQIDTYEDWVHRYTSQRMLKLWNSVRILRLFVNEHIHHYLTAQHTIEKFQTEEWTQARESAMAISAKMISDVLASVPLCLESSMSPMVSARSLVYPLTGVAVSKLGSPRAKRFAHNRLAFIGSEYGLIQAAESAHMVSQTRDMEDW
ncbi:hypothetical protein AWENTII_011861 [Aspergillus wentii]